MTSGFAELCATTNFSFLRGASHGEELAFCAKALGLAGLGVGDRNTLAGVVRAHAAAKEAGLRLAVGARLVFQDGAPDIFAYPRDRAAYARLTRLLTIGNRRAPKGECFLRFEDFLEWGDGLLAIVCPLREPSLPSPLVGEGGAKRRMRGENNIFECLSRHPSSVSAAAPPIHLLPQGEKEYSAADDCALTPTLLSIRNQFGAVWLAAPMRIDGEDKRRLAWLKALARDTGARLIATTEPLHHVPERRALLDVLTCVREKTTLDDAGRLLAANAERHLKSPQEIARLYGDAPEAVAETLRFLDQARFSLDELSYQYPDEAVAGYETPQHALEALTWAGAAKRYPRGAPESVKASLERELEIVAQLNYAPYFLTVADIVRFAREERGILCQGRGSAANSSICYCLGVTEVDPAASSLLFDRFISTERNEPPDIDVDFEHERREEVIQYVYEKYGRHRAALAATLICYRGRSAIRDVCKAFGYSEDRIAALSRTQQWWSKAVTPENLRELGLDAGDPRLMQCLALVKELRGFPRHLSQHVGGLVITRDRLDDVVPIQNAAMADRTVVEWDKDDLQELKILKVDILALGMLTCIRKAFDLVHTHYPDWAEKAGEDQPKDYGSALSSPAQRSEAGEVDRARSARDGGGGAISHRPLSHASRDSSPVNGGAKPLCLTLAALPKEDPRVYAMLQRADSIGVFQVESRAQMSMLPRLKPETFYDLVIEVAIVRPGPIQGGMVHPYLKRKQGLEKVSYPSKALEAVLKRTLGVPLFQEQAMQIAIVGAGFSPPEADKLRRAMATFRRVGTIGQLKEKFINGMVANGYAATFAEASFRQIEGFGEYGFPESHAASFALLVYASSWLKCHYPDVFAAALLNAQPMGFYAPAQIVRDAQEHGVAVLPIDVNCSDWDNVLEVEAAHPVLPCEGELSAKQTEGEEPPPPSWLTPGHLPLTGEDGGASAIHANIHPRHGDQARDIRTTHAVRLGFRQIKGLNEEELNAFVRHRGQGYDSVRDAWLRGGLSPATIEKLADADAFRSLGLDRRDALWAARGLNRVGGQEDLPLFSSTPDPTQEPDFALPPMLIGEHIVEDYRALGLSLKAHPLALLRADLNAKGVTPCEQLASIADHKRVRVAGLVLVRQRPGTASGVIFMTLEDEGHIANIVVWPKVFEQHRTQVLGARLCAVEGRVQSERGVVHVVAERLIDYTPLLARLSAAGLEPSLARADEVRRPQADGRTHPRNVRHDLRYEQIEHVMPRGRNFH